MLKDGGIFTPLLWVVCRDNLKKPHYIRHSSPLGLCLVLGRLLPRDEGGQGEVEPRPTLENTDPLKGSKGQDSEDG